MWQTAKAKWNSSGPSQQLCQASLRKNQELNNLPADQLLYIESWYKPFKKVIRHCSTQERPFHKYNRIQIEARQQKVTLQKIPSTPFVEN
jgi:hypothetical protein